MCSEECGMNEDMHVEGTESLFSCGFLSKRECNTVIRDEQNTTEIFTSVQRPVVYVLFILGQIDIVTMPKRTLHINVLL